MKKRDFRPVIVAPAILLGITLALTSCVEQGKLGSATDRTVGKPGIINFKAEPPKVREGGEVTLIWETDRASSVSISGLGQVPLSGSQKVTMEKSTTYELTASNVAGDTTKTLRVSVMVPYKGHLPPGAGVHGTVNAAPEKVSKKMDAGRLSAPDPLSPDVAKKDKVDVQSKKEPTSTETLKWPAVPGAVSYTVEIDCFNCCQANRWCTDVGKNYRVIESIKTTRHDYDVNFDKTKRGRWRVWSVGKKGVQGKKSEWHNFR